MQDFAIAIPSSLENMQLPSPELIAFYKNLENRTLWLEGEVNDYFLEYGRYIIQWNREDKGIPVNERQPIKLMFFSPGGDLDVNNAIIDLIEMSKTPVYGYNMGVAQSAGCFMYMACHKRFAMPNATFLLHQGSSALQGNYNEVVATVIEYQRQVEKLEEFVKKHSGIDEETLAENIGTEWFVTAQDAFELYHFVDEIITDIDMVV